MDSDSLKRAAPSIMPLAIVALSAGLVFFGRDYLAVPDAPQKIVVVDTSGNPVAMPTATGTAAPVVKTNTGEITGPTAPVKFGSLCTFKLPPDVDEPQWELVPPLLTIGLADSERTLQVSTDKEGEYVVIAGGLRKGKAILWKFSVTILPHGTDVKPVTPVKPVEPVTPVTPVTPVSPSIPTPSPELQAAVAPVKQLMATADPVKANRFASAWSDFAVAVRVMPPNTLAEFESVLATFLNAVGVKADLVGAFPGFSTAATTAIRAYLGKQDGKLDLEKAVAFVQAVAWACSR